MAINPNNGIPSPDAQNAAIMKQFATARQGLQYQKANDMDVANMAADRNQAVSGLSGGAALKTHENASRAVNQSYSGAESNLSSQEAAAQGQVAATQEAQQFQSSETAKQLAQQQSQFEKNYGLASKQFEASKDQFAKQMDYQWKEFTQNQQTNYLNTVTALNKAFGSDLGDTITAAKKVMASSGVPSVRAPNYYM